MPRPHLASIAGVALALLPASGVRGADDLPPAAVRVATFSTSLPLLAAQAKGFFAGERLAVSTFQVRSSVEMFQRLRDGLCDVAFSSPDNPVNYRLNTHHALGAPLDVQMILGTDYGLGLSVVARPERAAPERLRGARLGVDAVDSGFAFVLYQLLARHGLRRDVDYSVAAVGGTPLRLAALRAGNIDATLLNADSLVRALEEGMKAVAPASELADPYLGGVASARRPWLEANRGVAVRFVRAYWRGQRWAMDPAHRAEAVALLADASTPPALAGKILDALLDRSGLVGDARLDLRALRGVLEVRRAAGGFEAPQDLELLASPRSELLDLTYYQEAVGGAAGSPDGGRAR